MKNQSLRRTNKNLIKITRTRILDQNSLFASLTEFIDRKKQFDQEWSIPQLSKVSLSQSSPISNVSTLNYYTLHTRAYSL